MIVPEERLEGYLGKSLDDLEGRVSEETLRKLREYHPRESGVSVIDHLFLCHQKGGQSLGSLARDIGTSSPTLKKVFDYCELPTLERDEGAKRVLQDPGFKERHAAAMRRMWGDPRFREMQSKKMREQQEDPDFMKKIFEGVKRKWEDPGFREMHSERFKKYWGDDEFREKRAKGHEAYWKDPEHKNMQGKKFRELLENPDFMEKRLEGIKRKWEDPRFREMQSEKMKKQWEDPQFRERLAESHKKALSEKWRDPRFREKMVEAARGARLNPENMDKYYLPTIRGYRKDIDFYAQSAWEANLARVFMYCRREFSIGEVFRLKVPEKYKGMFESGVTEKRVDFMVEDPRGNMILYEIMAHPLENPVGYAKLELLIQQHPVKIRTIDGKSYARLRRHFENKINNTPGLSGWEAKDDNLRTNPGKYG